QRRGDRGPERRWHPGNRRRSGGFSNTGTVLFQGTRSQGGSGFFGYVPIVADLDLDGAPEIIAGSTAYCANGGIYWDRTAFGQPNIFDGYTAVGNFNGDPFPEVVIKPFSDNKLFLLNHDGSTIW